MNQFLLLASAAMTLALPSVGNSQTCSVTGNVVVCPTPSGQMQIQQQLNPNIGVMIAPDGSVQPYTILTPNAPGLQPPPPIILPPSSPAPIVMPTPSVSGY